jgi:hypothetical protein
MKTLLFLFVVLCSSSAFAQTPSTFYGIVRENFFSKYYEELVMDSLEVLDSSTIKLGYIDPVSGELTTISQNSLSPVINLTGAAIDPYNNLYHYIGFNVFKSVDMTTGELRYSVPITNPNGGTNFQNFRFNNSDTSLYGLVIKSNYDSADNFINSEMYLSTITVQTGEISQISKNSIGMGFALAGSAIDPYQKVYYYSTGTYFMGIDMYTGEIYSTAKITIPKGGVIFDNFTYNCVDNTIYGLIRNNYFSKYYDELVQDSLEVLDSTSIHFGKIDPATGIVTTISPYSIAQGGYSLNSGSTIDPNSLTYFYNNGQELVGVSLVSGIIESRNPIYGINKKYFELMRIQSDCIEATEALRGNPVLSVETIEDSYQTIMFPNPTNDVLKIQSTKNISSINVLSSNGTILTSVVANAPAAEINVAGLADGVYFVQYKVNNETFFRKIVKQNLK